MSCEGHRIRKEIRELLASYNFIVTENNVETVFSAHMGDRYDRPLGEVISRVAHKLER